MATQEYVISGTSGDVQVREVPLGSLTGANPSGTTYYYAVSSVVSGVESTIGGTKHATVLISYLQSGKAMVILNWQGVASATEYRVYRTTGNHAVYSDWNNVLIGSTTQTFFIDTNLPVQSATVPAASGTECDLSTHTRYKVLTTQTQIPSTLTSVAFNECKIDQKENMQPCLNLGERTEQLSLGVLQIEGELKRVKSRGNFWHGAVSGFQQAGTVNTGVFYANNIDSNAMGFYDEKKMTRRLGAPLGLAINVGSGSGLTGTYRYMVACVGSNGFESIACDEVSTGSITNKTAALTWTAVSGISYYKIYRTSSAGSTGTEVYLASSTTNSYSDSTDANTNTEVPITIIPFPNRKPFFEMDVIDLKDITHPNVFKLFRVRFLEISNDNKAGVNLEMNIKFKAEVPMASTGDALALFS